MPSSKIPEGSDLEKQISQEYSDGWTMGQLAERHGTNVTTVRRSLLRTNTPIRPRGYPKYRLEGESYWTRYYRKLKEDPERRVKYYASIRRKQLRYKYGINPEDYDALFELQGGKCGVCGATEMKLVVDHDHSTGRVRGLLYDRCNHMIGHSRDNPDNLRSAIYYLEAPPAEDLEL